jgi:voltage-dependent potassium channel beta subunit
MNVREFGPMRYRRMGRSGLYLSEVSLGTWATIGERLDFSGSLALLAEAYHLGVNFFDGGETYGDGAAEEALGRAMVKLGWPRETFAVSGKVYWGTHGGRPNTCGLSRKHIIEGCHATLRRLRLDYLDLFLCHRPDADTPVEETVEAMTDLVRQGKILYWGTSEWPADRFRAAHEYAVAACGRPPVVEQLQYNIMERNRVEREYADLIDRLGIGLTVWSPLAYGLLAGRYDRGFPAAARLSDPRYAWLRAAALGGDEEIKLARYRAVNALARASGLEPTALAVAWVLRNPRVSSAVCGASSPEQLRMAVAAATAAPRLDEALLDEIDVAAFGGSEYPTDTDTAQGQE